MKITINLFAAFALSLFLPHTSSAAWMLGHQSTNLGYWSVACSSNGTTIIAAGWGGETVISTNSGRIWSQQSFPSGGAGPSAATTAADGRKLIAITAGAVGNQLRISDDSGTTWGLPVPIPSIDTIAPSADATKLAGINRFIGSYSHSSRLPISISTNSGTTWTTATNAPNSFWAGVASSADGSTLAAAENPGHIYVSSDSGATWTATGPSNYWSCVAVNADGTQIVAGVGSLNPSLTTGGVFISTDAGSTWTQTSAPVTNWISIASSADGTHLFAGTYLGDIFATTNSGATWTSTGAPASQWGSIACSTNGQFVVAGDAQYGGPVGAYLLPAVPPTILGLAVNPDRSVTVDCSNFPAYYCLEATTNLAAPASWQTLSTNLYNPSSWQLTNDVWKFMDTDAATLPHRFYRLRLP